MAGRKKKTEKGLSVGILNIVQIWSDTTGHHSVDKAGTRKIYGVVSFGGGHVWWRFLVGRGVKFTSLGKKQGGGESGDGIEQPPRLTARRMIDGGFHVNSVGASWYFGHETGRASSKLSKYVLVVRRTM